MNRLGSEVCVLVFLSVCAADADARSVAARGAIDSISIAGTVYSAADHRRIDHADVRLCESHGSALLQEQFTQSSGDFTFRGVPPAVYVLSISAHGFENQDQRVDASLASEMGLSVYLRPASHESNPDVPGNKVSAHEMSIPQSARDLVAAGKKKIWLGKNYEAGLADLRRAADTTPGYYEAYYEMGLTYLRLGKLDDAEDNFQKSIDMSGGKYGDAEVGLGAALVNKGNVAEGEKALRRGVEVNPNSSLGFYELAKIELSQDRIADAEKYAEQSRSLAPDFPSVYRMLSNIHLRQHNYAAVLRDVDAYLQLDPNSPAGVRAKQIRDEIRRKMETEVATAPANPAPH
jgi:tetratricopeptide (TPR) repeat protein